MAEALWRLPPLSPSAKVLLRLLTRAYGDGDHLAGIAVQASFSELARATGYSIPAVLLAVKTLKAAGLVTVEPGAWPPKWGREPAARLPLPNVYSLPAVAAGLAGGR